MCAVALARLALPTSYRLLSLLSTKLLNIRAAHNDMKPPDFTPYRREKGRWANRKNDTHHERNAFTYLMVGAAAVGGTYSTKRLVEIFVSSMSVTADVLAMATIEIKLADIPEGKSVTIKWRGKPLFVWHRSQSDVDEVRKVDINTLRDPERDEDRVQRPEWLVVIGVCTHLGCVPIAGAGDFGGYYCPCHGSHFDASGRVRRGPAPSNLAVPEYSFPNEATMLVG